MGELQSTLTRREFESWREYYRMYPFDDLHRYHRPAALVARSMGGGDVRELIDWLQPPAGEVDLSDADIVTLRAFGIRKE